MQVVAILVNGEFRVHQSGCRDIAADCHKSGCTIYPFEADSHVDVALKCFSALIPDEMDLGEALNSMAFLPCTEDLPVGPENEPPDRVIATTRRSGARDCDNHAVAGRPTSGGG
jgi:hypothetical protein